MKLTLLALLSALPLCAQAPPTFSWLTFHPGSRPEVIHAVRPAADGTVWVAGSTRSDLILAPPNEPFRAILAGGTDLFIARYRPLPNGGSTLLFWTLYGGTGEEIFGDFTVGANGFLYLAGSTDSLDLPLAGPSQRTEIAGDRDAFVAVFDPNSAGADSLVYASYFGGAAAESVAALPVRPDGAFILIGETTSTDLTLSANAMQSAHRGARDLFLIQFNPFLAGSPLYASYLGGTLGDSASAAVLDQAGYLWITGVTNSPDFPVTFDPGTQTSLHSQLDGFLARLDLAQPGLDAITYVTFLGGALGDFPTALHPGPGQQVYLTGYTFSPDFPTTANALQRSLRGEIDAFLLLVDGAQPPAQRLTYSSYFGGAGADIPQSITVLPDGRAALSGYVANAGLPVTAGAPQPTPASVGQEGFLAVVDPRRGAEGLPLLTYFGGAYRDNVNAIGAAPDGQLFFGGSTDSPELVGTDGTSRQQSPRDAAAFVGRLTL
jgi:hypothetical protein